MRFGKLKSEEIDKLLRLKIIAIYQTKNKNKIRLEKSSRIFILLQRYGSRKEPFQNLSNYLCLNYNLFTLFLRIFLV